MRGLNFLIALSSFGNIIAVQVGLSRQIRECGRQGVLPFTRFWVSTRPFGTPLGPYAVVWFMIALMTLAVPAGNAFTFVNDLSMLPKAAFNFAIAVGIYVCVGDERMRLFLFRSLNSRRGTWQLFSISWYRRIC